MNKSKKTLLVIGGPTAVGKTALAIDLAQKLGTEIVSADSRQVFSELCIGVARPSLEELDTVKHHLIATQSIHNNYNAGAYEQEAIPLLDKLFTKYDIVVLVGGSGLYIDALINGLDVLPETDPILRDQLNLLFKEQGIEELQRKVQELDPVYYTIVDQANHRRLIRALEVSISSGRPYSSFTTKQKTERYFDIKYAVAELPRAELYERIGRRVDQMMESGLLNEVKELFPLRHLNALHTVGYSEFFQHFEGKHSLEEAIELLKQNTRRYAKRQLTWFRRVPQAQWFHPESSEEVLAFLESRI